NLDPSSVPDVLQDIRTVGAALAVPERAAEVVAGLEARIAAVCTRAAGAPRRRCVVLEWIAPPYRSGHWTPELVAIAGGTEPLGRVGEDAARVPWEAVLSAAPEVLVLACCGYDLTRTMADVPLLGGAADHVRLAGTHEGEERAQPALGHVEHDLARLDAGGGELLEYEVGEGAHVLLASAAGELPCAHRIEGHHEPLGVLAPELGTASPAAAAHADAHELEAPHAARISPRPTAVKPGA